MPHAHSADQLAEQPAIGLFEKLSFIKIQNLRRKRDLLLPRLLSGQLSFNT